MNTTRQFVIQMFDSIVGESSQLIERALYNFAIDYSNQENISPSWESFMFSHLYKQKATLLHNTLQNRPDICTKIMNDEIACADIPVLDDLIFKQIQNETKEEVCDGLFKCGRCGSKKTTYYSLQTRSADEPMTNFITCVSCAHRWKM